MVQDPKVAQDPASLHVAEWPYGVLFEEDASPAYVRPMLENRKRHMVYHRIDPRVFASRTLYLSFNFRYDPDGTSWVRQTLRIYFVAFCFQMR